MKKNNLELTTTVALLTAIWALTIAVIVATMLGSTSNGHWECLEYEGYSFNSCPDDLRVVNSTGDMAGYAYCKGYGDNLLITIRETPLPEPVCKPNRTAWVKNE